MCMKKIVFFVIGGGLLFIGGYLLYRYKSQQQPPLTHNATTILNHEESRIELQKDEPAKEIAVPFSGIQESFLLDNDLSMKIQEISNNTITIPDLQNESEDLLIKKNSDFVKRDSQGLHLKIAQGGEKIIEDNLSDADVDIGKFQRNSFKEFRRDAGFYIIGTGVYEGGFYKLINASTGKEYTTGGYPYFSPDGKYILTAGFDIEAGYSFNGLELFENNKGNITLLKKYEPSRWGALAIQWVDTTSARVKAKSLEFIDHEMVEHEMYLDVMIVKK